MSEQEKYCRVYSISGSPAEGRSRQQGILLRLQKTADLYSDNKCEADMPGEGAANKTKMGDYDGKKDNADKYSLRGRVFRKLREDILSGRYAEHEELKEMAIGEEMGVSRTPVREAFRQLELEGLIQIVPNKGAYVVGITEKDVKDIYVMRSLLEGLCARWATEHISKAQMEEMEENVYLAEFHARKGHLNQLADLDNRFHDIMYEACDSKLLEHNLKDLHQYVLRVRKKTLANADRGLQSNEEHKNIMEAIKAGDGGLAERLAHQHMINAYDNMVKNGLHEVYDTGRSVWENRQQET